MWERSFLCDKTLLILRKASFLCLRYVRYENVLQDRNTAASISHFVPLEYAGPKSKAVFFWLTVILSRKAHLIDLGGESHADQPGTASCL